MAERTQFESMGLHPDRKLVTQLDEIRGSDFRTALLISGAVTSNSRDVLSGGGRIYQVSSPVKVRMLNLEMFNQENGWLEIEFRDGGEMGGRVLGPYVVQGRNEKRLSYDEMRGRYFTSSVHAVVLSGWQSEPLTSNGVKVNMSFVAEPTDYYE